MFDSHIMLFPAEEEEEGEGEEGMYDDAEDDDDRENGHVNGRGDDQVKIILVQEIKLKKLPS
jgi:hypothetical protein